MSEKHDREVLPDAVSQTGKWDKKIIEHREWIALKSTHQERSKANMAKKEANTTMPLPM